MFEFYETSQRLLSMATPTMQKVFNKAITITPVDFGILYSHRPPEEQFEIFKKGREYKGGKWVIVDRKKVVTYKDGYTKKSTHNKKPSPAIDIFVHIPGRPDLKFNEYHHMFLGGLITAVAKEMYNKGEIDKQIRWGGNWDGDGILIYDQHLNDLCHYEEI